VSLARYALLALGLLLACSDRATEQRPWYVSRFGGAERSWKLDVARRIVPQRKPAMLSTR
jgi:hypothetical protein